MEQKIIIAISGHIYTDQRMKRIAGSLSANGADVCLYYREHFKYTPVATKDQLRFTTKAMRIKAKDGILFYLLLNWYLLRKLLFKPVDVYYAVDADTLPAMTLLSLIRRKKLVYDAHEYFCEVPELKHSPLKKSIWHWVTKLGVKRAWRCITVGPALALELEKRYGKPFHVVRNTTELQTNIKDIELTFEWPSKPVIIYQGALNAGRELELLIEAMKELPECHCLLVGEGDLSKALRQQAAGMTNVQFAGLLSPDTLRSITPKCFAGYNLLDAQGSLSYYFSLSNKYFDYIHAGIPSISSELPEYMALNAKYQCGVCLPNKKTDLIALIKKWLSDPELYQKFRENTNIARPDCQWRTDEALVLDLFKP